MSETTSTRIGELTNIIDLVLSDNMFEGTIPPEIGNNIETVYLAVNDFTSPIPTELGNCMDLSKYDEISQTQISPYIDDVYFICCAPKYSRNCSFPSLYNLIVNGAADMSIKLNRFTGPVPTKVCHLSFLGLIVAAADCAEEDAVSSGLGFNQATRS
eukprot:scaffold29559_cov34-Attheya_sp.AAC.1